MRTVRRWALQSSVHARLWLIYFQINFTSDDLRGYGAFKLLFYYRPDRFKERDAGTYDGEEAKVVAA